MILILLFIRSLVLFRLKWGEWDLCNLLYVFWIFRLSVFLLWLKVEMVLMLMVLLIELRFWLGVNDFSILIVFSKFVGNVFRLIVWFLFVLVIFVLFMLMVMKFGFNLCMVINLFLFLFCCNVMLGRWCRDFVMFWFMKLFNLLVEIIELNLFFICFKLWVFRFVVFIFLIWIIFRFCCLLFCCVCWVLVLVCVGCCVVVLVFFCLVGVEICCV